MKNRIIATTILWSLVIILPWLLGKWGGFILIGVLGTGAFVELLDLLHRAGRPVDRTVALASFPLLLLAFMLIPPWALPPLALLSLFLSGILVACLLNATMGTFSATVMPTLGSVLMLGITMVSAILIVHESGIMLLIWIVAIAKFGDVGALLTGTWIGKHRMAPGYSPNKTWEGLIGGILLAIIVSILFFTVFKEHLPESINLYKAGIIALFVTIAAVMADLMESAFKREAKVKDSGNSIPGIGGFLDLADSMILALPVGYALFWIFV